MSGAPDRGGGREGKKSLRKTKQNIDAKVKAIQKGHATGAAAGPDLRTAQPPAVHPLSHAMPLVDCGVQLINRQFDRDQLKVLQRAAASGVEAFVAYTSDFEKAEALARLAKENTSVIYCMVGVHSDMTKRSNDKLSPQRLEQLRELLLRPETVALMAGLDFSRDIGIRYAQERALSEQMTMAAEVGLPLMLYQVFASEALATKIREFMDHRQPEPASHGTTAKAASPPAPNRIAIFNFHGTEAELSVFVSLGCYIAVSGRAAAPGDDGEALRATLLTTCPLGRLLVCSDAPYSTPQNIEDAFMREGRNEPSNLPYVVKMLASAYGVGEPEMSRRLRGNAFEFFGLQAREEPAATEHIVERKADAATGSPTVPATAGEEKGKPGCQDQPGTSGSGDDSDGDAAGSEDVAQRGNLVDATSHDGDSDDPDECGTGAAQGPAGTGGRRQQQQQQRRRKEQPEAVAAQPRKPVDRSYLVEQDGGAAPPRITYSCRGCRSILFSELDVRPHLSGAANLGPADFKRTKGGGKQRSMREEQLCSLHFLKTGMPWMDLAPPQPEAEDGAGPGAEPASGPVQEGRLACPCCGAKIGKFDLTGNVSCSCGVEVPAPAFGLLRARLDIKDAVLDLGRAVQSSLRLYEAAADGESASESEGSDQGHKKTKKKKGAKGRGNTGNFSTFRNKTFGVSAKPAAKAAKGGGSQQVESAGGSGSES